MSAWLVYIKERFPLPTYFLLCGGFVLSAATLTGSAFPIFKTAFIFMGLLVFFAELRLMDEFKDYQKDLIAHPQRPLPRGLLKVAQVRTAITWILRVMIASGLLYAFQVHPLAGFLYVAITIYLYGMFREFFLGSWLEAHMILYAISHQLVLLLLASFAVAVYAPELVLQKQSVLYALVVLGTFFNYEVGRKLDPKALPILKTYRIIYGETKTFLFLFVLSTLGSVSAVLLEPRLGWGLLVLLSVGLVTVYGAFYKNLNYKIAEGFATLGLLYGIWFGFLMKFVV